jgi:DNA-binding NtrC family response regulator
VTKKSAILVVEDEPTLRAMMADILTDAGYSCLTAGNALDAIQIIESDVVSFDMLLSDVLMPGKMNGFQLARRVRELKPATRVLLITGYIGNDLGDAMKENPFRIIPKPFRPNDLVAAVSKEFAKPLPAAANGETGDTGSIVSIEKARR